MPVQVSLDDRDCEYLRKVEGWPQPYVDTQEVSVLLAGGLIELDKTTNTVSITTEGKAKLAAGCP